jgi:peroxiredoxin
MSELENPPNPVPPAPNDAPGTKLSPARWIAGAAVVVAVALFAIPLFIDGPGRASSSDDPSATASGEPAESSGVCLAKKAPAKLAYTVKDMNGADVRLGDYKGKVILLNYWATWCGPCKVEIPDLVALQEQFKEKGFVILGVSQDDDPETLRAFASAFKMNYPVLVGRDQPDLLDAQGPLWGLPTTYLIARDGTICTRHLGPATKEDLEREIKALL